MDISQYMLTLGQQAKVAARVIARASTKQKNRALIAIATVIRQQQAMIEQANAIDITAGEEKGLDAALLDRLRLTPDRIEAMAVGVEQVAHLADPIGEISQVRYLPSGIQLGQMRVPLGVIGIIYESRPNVTVDAAALCLKSGNATILRGGSESIQSNQAIAQCIRLGLEQADLPSELVQVVDTTERAAVGAMITLSDYIDVIVPRGGKSLISRVSAEATIPVIKHLDGICHVYIDRHADLDMAEAIAINAKCHRYGVCNAMETLLIDQAVAAELLPRLASAYKEKQVELRGCQQTQAYIDCHAATEEDWQTEYLAAILSIRVVTGLEAAIQHIQQYGSQHTDAIVTAHSPTAQQFIAEVDSSSVMVNASTRFADGFEYGLGAEIGISTDKIHARGPVGLIGLTSQKWLALGNGQIRV